MLFLIGFSTKGKTQATFYLPDSAIVYLGDQSPAGIFGFVRNSGNLSIKSKGQLYFLGKIWINEKTAKMTDESLVSNSVNGGTINFVQPLSTFGRVGQQIFQPGFNDADSTGPVFSNITINNPSGVILSSDIQVLNTLDFKAGHLYLNNYQYISGNESYTGKFTGYTPQRFIVTGKDVTGGFVKYRKVNTNVQVTFPIGISKDEFTPLQITNKGAADAFMARAFTNVYSNATSGNPVQDSTLQVTWIINKNTSATSEIAVRLQNEMNQEDPVFRNMRESSYVSLYNQSAGWDKPYLLNTPQTPGDITSSFANPASMVNARKVFINGAPLYLTKKVSEKKVAFIIPNVFSPNGDGINDTWTIKGLNEYDHCTVEIYNRYGQMIYRSNGYNKPWDGTYNGKPLPVATYYYIVDLRDGHKPLAGSITVLR